MTGMYTFKKMIIASGYKEGNMTQPLCDYLCALKMATPEMVYRAMYETVKNFDERMG